MGLKSTRPLPLATAPLAMAAFFKRRFRTWHLDHVALVLERYRELPPRHCIDALQLATILGIKDQAFVRDVMKLFMPRTPTRVHHMVDVMEIIIALVLVCQAPSMLHRFEAIFDILDADRTGMITPADLVVLFGAVARAMMKLFEYTVEPEQRAAMQFVDRVLSSGIDNAGKIEKTRLCKLILSDKYAVHYTKQCTGEDKPKLYVQLAKETEFIGAIEFETEADMKAATLKTIRAMADEQLYNMQNDFMFTCQGREVKRVWEGDRKAWSIVPFALRGSPGLHAYSNAKNRRMERPSHPNPFEFRYMGNTIARYKKKLDEVNPVYKHQTFKLDGTERKILNRSERWRVAENWSGQWVYDQDRIRSRSKLGIQKRLRSAVKAKSERVVIKNQRGELISPLMSEENVGDSRPNTSAIEPVIAHRGKQNLMQSVRDRNEKQELRKKKIRWKARVIAMDMLQNVDTQEFPASSPDKENEPRNVNITSRRSITDKFKSETSTTVLVQVHDGRDLPSRLIQQNLQKRNRLQSGLSSDKKLDVSILTQKLQLSTPSLLSSGKVRIGPFCAASNIPLKEDEVEVFPVLVIQPCGDVVDINVLDPETRSDPQENPRVIPPALANTAYLSDVDFRIGPTESNYECVYHHIHGIMQDAITLNRLDVMGRTILHDAAEHGHGNLMEVLLKQRVLRDVGDTRGDTPLHHAARNSHLREVSALLREGASPWKLNNEGKSALYCALERAAHDLHEIRPSHMQPSRGDQHQTREHSQGKNFLAGNQKYNKLRQVIDLLWDRYPPQVLAKGDYFDRSNCMELEKQVYGDMFRACRDGNVVRVQRLIDLEKRPVAQYINDTLSILGRTALHEATEQGHTAIVDMLLKFGADGYVVDQRMQIPLHLAATKGYERIVKCLVNKFTGTAGMQDCAGKTPLHLAIERGHQQIALTLIMAMKALDNSEGAINAQDEYGYTPLHYGCIRADLLVCSALVDSGAYTTISRCEYRVSKGRRHLLGVYWKKFTLRGVLRQSIAQLRARYGFSDFVVAFDIESPIELLLKTCKYKSHDRSSVLALVKLLFIQSKSPPDLDNGKTTRPTLHHQAALIASADMSLAIDVCKLLSMLKYEINMIDMRTGETALLQECKRLCESEANINMDSSQLELVRTLIQLGANIDFPNEVNGETPLGCAAAYGNLRLLDLLLEAGAQPNVYHKLSFSALHFAVRGGHFACAKALLNAKANINIQLPPRQDETPLFFAIRSKNEELVELLLQNDADPCALCTIHHSLTTSFNIRLSIWSEVKPQTTRNEPKKREDAPANNNNLIKAASPLTFALLLAQQWTPYASQEESIGIDRARERHAWEVFRSMAMILARHALATTAPSGNTASSLITRQDIDLACRLGFWDLVKNLLTYQVTLSSARTVDRMNALHLAAAAGRTDIVTALVAAGMNVNSVLTRNTLGTKSSRVPTIRTKFHGQQMMNAASIGTLHFALVNGHPETAAHLLVLGARPLETMIYYWSARRVRDRANDTWIDREEVIFVVSERMDKKMRDLYFRDKGSRSCDTPVTQSYHRERVAINFIQHLQMSINLKVPILHYMAAMGYTSGVQMLVEAGMNVLQPSQPTNPFNLKIPEWNAESAIHVAILRGHLDVIRYFAMLAQFNFPRYFLRENQKPESLLVVACRTKRVDVVRYLLSNGSVNGEGGGYNGRDSPGDIEKAMNTCAAYHFEAGFDMMLAENGCPDLSTLVQVVQSVHWIEKEGAPFVSSVDSKTTAKPSVDLKKPTALPLSKRVHLRFCASSHRILLAICRFSQNFDDFFKVLSFDHILKVLIICSQYEQWEVLEKVFVANESRFLNTLNPWTPVLVRAACCCLVMHRAAAANQVGLIRFFLKLGVPADLQLCELGAVKCPVWYAASRGVLDAFVVLALYSTNLTHALTSYCVGGFRVHYRSISATTSWFSTASTCRWQSLSSMSCYEISKSQRAVYLIQKLINMWIRENRGRLGYSLLHLACETGNLSLIQVLVDAGADILARNTAGSTPLMIAAARQDPFGASVTRYLVGQLRHRGSDEDVTSNLGRALVSCFAEPPPCNLKTAKILLAAGADSNYQDGERSALMFALQTLQFAGTKVLVDNGGKLTIALVEVFLQQIQSIASDQATLWRRYSSLLKQQGQNVLEIESLLLLFLDKKNGYAVNNDLLLTMLTASAAIAATVAKASGYDQKFWCIVSNILDQYGSSVATRKSEWNRKTALHFAVQAVEIPIIRKLVDVGKFDVDAEDEYKVTPLHLIARNGDPVACQVLLSGIRNQQRVDSVDSKGRTPLHVAITHGHEAVAMQFVVAGASLRTYCHQGWNALVCAARLNHLSILMALYARDSSRELLCSRDGEFAMFIAANHAAFRVVRWFMAMYKDIQSPEASQSIYSVTCKQRLRTLLHYAAIYGDQELVNTLLTSKECSSDIIDQRDAAGYTALMYAFAFGKLAVVETLCRFGATADLVIDHTGDGNAHPYATTFTIGGLSTWFALPGWFSHVSSQFPPTEKRHLTSFVTSEEHYLLGSGYQKRRVRAPIHTDRFRTDLLREYEMKRVRTTMKCWQFPRMSLFEYAQDVGDESLISLLFRLGLSSLVQTVSFTRRRNGFLQLVRWNRLEIVKALLGGPSKSVWAEFIEVGVDCAVSRALEEMTIYLLSKWQGHKDSSVPADASAFAFQFAHVFQVACIRRLLRLIEYMIECGGEHIVGFHWNEGPALVYAFAFGHADIASRFIAQGAHISTMDTYRAPSFKKWIEYGCPQEVQVSWYELSAPKEATLRERVATLCPPFIGPVEVYEPPQERLDTKAMASLFLPVDNGEEEDTRTTPELSTDEVYVAVT